MQDLKDIDRIYVDRDDLNSIIEDGKIFTEAILKLIGDDKDNIIFILAARGYLKRLKFIEKKYGIWYNSKFGRRDSR